MTHFYETSYANIHRGVYDLGRALDRGLRGRPREGARVRERRVGARDRLHAQRTAALNLVAYAWGLDNLGARRPRARHRARAPLELRPVAVHRRADGRRASRSIPIDDNGELAARRARRARDARARRRSSPSNLVSNSLGTINPIAARRPGRTSAARSWSSTPRRPRRTGRWTSRRSAADFLAFTAHKMCGPTGSACSGAGAELLEAMSPFELGGADDPQGHGREDDLERAAAQVRGGHAADRRGGRPRQRPSTT